MTDEHDPFSRAPMDAPDVTADVNAPGIAPAPLVTDMPGEEMAAPSTSVLEGGADLMTKDEFFVFFAGLFPVAGAMIAIKNPPPLQSLITAGELPTARPASDAIYDLANANAWLQWLLDKNGKWMMQAVAIAAFGSQVFNGVSAELAARKEAQAAKEAAKAPEPA